MSKNYYDKNGFILKKNKFSVIKRLKVPHKTDMDINQMKEHKFSKLKFGTGELRYFFQYAG